MARTKNPNRISIHIAAQKLGMGKEALMAELQRDAQRPISERKYPFADPVQNQTTGTWLYNINAQLLNNHLCPQSDIDYDLLAEKTAQKIVELIVVHNHALKSSP